MQSLKCRSVEVGLIRAVLFRPPLARVAGIALCATFLFSAAAALRAADKPDEQTLVGKLIFVPGTGPVLATSNKHVPLVGRNHYIFNTLEDKRLRDDEVRLKGTMRADGEFPGERPLHHSSWRALQGSLLLRDLQHRGACARQMCLLPAADGTPGNSPQ